MTLLAGMSRRRQITYSILLAYLDVYKRQM